MDLLKNILQDLRVELSDEFDKNFSRGGFFNRKWKKKWNGTDSHLIGVGTLRGSIKAQVSANAISFSSAVRYAAIHNEGGEITVTRKMKRFFWAMYQKTHQDRWKFAALKKVGSKIAIPQRQFIGESDEVSAIIEQVIVDNIDDYEKYFAAQLKKTKK